MNWMFFVVQDVGNNKTKNSKKSFEYILLKELLTGG